MEQTLMINKNSYRDYLLAKMERQTPVLEKVGTIPLVTPVSAPAKPLHPARKWVIGSLCAILSAFLVAFGASEAVAYLNQAKTPKAMSIEERNYMASRIYNTIVKDDESIPMADLTPYESSSDVGWNIFPFQYLVVVDSYYIQTSYDTNLTPFFDDSIRGKPVNTALALLKFVCGVKNGEVYSRIGAMIMLNFEGKTIGFLSGLTGDWDGTLTTIDEVAEKTTGHDTMSFSSNYFLTAGGTANEDGQAGIVSLDVSGKHETGYSIAGAYSRIDERGYFYEEPFNCSIDNNTYKKMGKEETIDLINKSLVEKKQAQAVILAIDKNKWALSVTSEELPSLKTVRFLKLETNKTTYDYDPDGILAIGDTIGFDYYVRYENYQPVDILSTTIRINK
jgi:hypothetical protein